MERISASEWTREQLKALMEGKAEAADSNSFQDNPRADNSAFGWDSVMGKPAKRCRRRSANSAPWTRTAPLNALAHKTILPTLSFLYRSLIH